MAIHRCVVLHWRSHPNGIFYMAREDNNRPLSKRSTTLHRAKTCKIRRGLLRQILLFHTMKTTLRCTRTTLQQKSTSSQLSNQPGDSKFPPYPVSHPQVRSQPSSAFIRHALTKSARSTSSRNRGCFH